jgi:quercetin dioxygenase-like cupin family protein
MNRLVLVSIAGLFVAGSAIAQTSGNDALPQGFKVTPVHKSGVTAGNTKFMYPQTDKPEIVSVIGELEPGGRTALHQHPVPVFVYVLEGVITVQAQGGQPREYKAGQAYIEDINHWHQASNKGSAPVKILVVFAGEEGKPTTVNAK